MGSMVDVLRRMVREQTNQVGMVVSNLYAAVAPEPPPIVVTGNQTWLYAKVPGRALISADQFMQLYASTPGHQSQVVTATNGVVIVSDTQQTLKMLRTMATVPSSINIQMTVSTGTTTAQFAVYIDGVLARRGVDSVEFSIHLDRGVHLIEVLAFTQSLGVEVPASLLLSGTLDIPGTPVWASVTSGWQDAKLGIANVQLSWYNDSRAGGWSLMRRQPTIVAPITAVGTPDQAGNFSITMDGDQHAAFHQGDEVLAGIESMGTATTAEFDPVADVTTVSMMMNPLRTDVNPLWLGRNAEVGRWAELARIRRTTAAGVISWSDNQVKVGSVYEYELIAFGVFDDSQVSNPSAIEYVVVGDHTPPGPIVFDPGYPVLLGGFVNAKYQTPIDEDYAGTNVYFRALPVFSGHTTGGNDFDHLNDTSTLLVSGEKAGWTLHIVSGVNGSPLDQFGTVLDNDAHSLLISGQWFIVPSGGWAYELWIDQKIVTHFGVPNDQDQVSFGAVRSGGPSPTVINSGAPIVSGEYIFRTFDFVGNEQFGSGEVVWQLSGMVGPPSYLNLLSDRKAPRITAQWGPPLIGVAAGFDLQFKETLADTWTNYGTLGPLALSAILGPFGADDIIDVRVDAFDQSGTRSDWVTVLSHAVVQTPNPTFGPFSGEATYPEATPFGPGIFDTSDGMAHLGCTMDANTDEVWVYTAEAPTSPVPLPAQVDNRRHAIIRRPDGDIGAADTFYFETDIATTPSYFRKILAFGVNWAKHGLPTVLECQAVDSGAGPPNDNPGRCVVLSNVGDTEIDIVLSGSNVDTVSDFRIFRNGLMIQRLNQGQQPNIDGAVWFQDTGLTPGQHYSYEVQYMRNYQCTLLDSFTSTQLETIIEQPPLWVTGYPKGVNYITNGGENFFALGATSNAAVSLVWTLPDPQAQVQVFYSDTVDGLYVPAPLFPAFISESLPDGWQGITNAGDVSCIVADQPAGTVKFFKLIAFRNGGQYEDSVDSEIRSATYGIVTGGGGGTPPPAFGQPAWGDPGALISGRDVEFSWTVADSRCIELDIQQKVYTGTQITSGTWQTVFDTENPAEIASGTTTFQTSLTAQYRLQAVYPGSFFTYSGIRFPTSAL